MSNAPRPASDEAPRLVFVTGASGAGRLTAINALADLGFEAIDNLPLGLLDRLLAAGPLDQSMALGIDTRNRDFTADGIVAAVDRLDADDDHAVDLLYLDCRPEVLLRRFSETRRRHPMALEENPEIGIEREIELLAPVRARADILVDTSDLTPHDLRAELTRLFAGSDRAAPVLSVQSFSYKRGLPRGTDLVFDVRFLANPHWEADLRPLDGRDPGVADYVASDPRFQGFFDRVSDLVRWLLPAYIAEGKTYLTIGFGCTGGQHRSVAVAEMLASALGDEGWPVSVRHRELERRGLAAPARDERDGV
ncbi:MAG: RNase adapter RapZ [Paracoccaceae bacterium]|nr:RNase adapter RapZ [Paracoccaceae bacterium]